MDQRPPRPRLTIGTALIAVGALCLLAGQALGLTDGVPGGTISETTAWVVYLAPWVGVPLGVTFLAWYGWHIGVDKGQATWPFRRKAFLETPPAAEPPEDA